MQHGPQTGFEGFTPQSPQKCQNDQTIEVLSVGSQKPLVSVVVFLSGQWPIYLERSKKDGQPVWFFLLSAFRILGKTDRNGERVHDCTHRVYPQGVRTTK